MHVLAEQTLSIDGFANLKERRYVMDEKHFGDYRDDDASPGLGNVTYLADAFIRPHGQTQRHNHRNADIITVLMRGRLRHQGSLGDGVIMHAGDIQVQRAGTAGFDHNEINPDNDFNRLIQIWALPQQQNEEATYDSFHCPIGAQKRVYTANTAPENTKQNAETCTVIDIIRPYAGEKLTFQDDILLFAGEGRISVRENNAAAVEINDPALIKATNLSVQIITDAWLIAIHNSAMLFRD